MPLREMSAHGLSVAVPPGWEGTIIRRPAGPDEVTFPVLHLATVSLPADCDDFGSNVVDRLGRDDAFVSLFEYGPASVGAPLFAAEGLPLPLRPDDFDPSMLQRTLPDQAGVQRFFSVARRAFSLYVVIGSHARRRRLVPAVNTALATLAVSAA